MAIVGHYQLNTTRLVAAFVFAPVALVAIHAGLMWPLWLIAFVVGSVCAAVLTVAVALPFVLWLSHRARLRISWVVLMAAILAALPDLAISFAGTMHSSGSDQLYAGGHYLIIDGELTAYGIFHFFLMRPAAFGLLGAFGGALFWVIAVGWRIAAPMTSNQHLQATQ